MAWAPERERSGLGSRKVYIRMKEESKKSNFGGNFKGAPPLKLKRAKNGETTIGGGGRGEGRKTSRDTETMQRCAEFGRKKNE